MFPLLSLIAERTVWLKAGALSILPTGSALRGAQGAGSSLSPALLWDLAPSQPLSPACAGLPAWMGLLQPDREARGGQ